MTAAGILLVLGAALAVGVLIGFAVGRTLPRVGE
jgi:hypothetical protein